MAKTMYHSEASKLGPILCEITTDIMKSRYKGKNDYVVMLVDGQERNYNVENEQCADRLRGRRGQKMMLEFLGGKDDADIRVVSATGTRQQPSQSQPQGGLGRGSQQPQNEPEQPPNAETPPPRTQQRQRTGVTDEEKAARLAKARAEVARLANCYLLCLNAADYIDLQVVEQLGWEPLTTQQKQAIATHLNICMTERDSRMHENMPTGILTLKHAS